MANLTGFIQVVSRVPGAKIKAYFTNMVTPQTTTITLSKSTNYSGVYIASNSEGEVHSNITAGGINPSTGDYFNSFQYLLRLEAQPLEGYTFIGWRTLGVNTTVGLNDAYVTPHAASFNTVVENASGPIGSLIYKEDIANNTYVKTQTVNNNIAGGGDGWIVYELEAVYQAVGSVHTVTFKDHDGTTIESKTVEHGQPVAPPSDPVRDGYVFTGWNADLSSVTSDMTVTAQYRQRGASLTVRFVSYSGSLIRETTVESGYTIENPPEIPARTGYTALGWYKGSDPFDVATTVVTSGMTLTATYQLNSYPLRLTLGDGIQTIYYKINGSSNYTATSISGSVNVNYGTTWYAYAVAASGRTYTATTASAPATGTMGVNGATFAPIASSARMILKRFYFSYNTSSGASKFEDDTTEGIPSSQNQLKSASDILNCISSVKMRLDNNDEYVECPVAIDTNFYKLFVDVYVPVASTVFFYFNLKPGYVAYVEEGSIRSGTLLGETYFYATSKRIPGLQVEAGYRINPVSSPEGQFYVSNVDENWPPTLNSLARDVAAYYPYGYPASTDDGAYCNYYIYFFSTADEKYRVEFVDYDGTLIDAQEVVKGNSATPPTSPTRTGMTFAGWSGSYTNVTADVTVTATYTPNRYNITLVRNGGTVNSYNVTNYTYGIGCQLPTDVTKIGFSFNGWYDNPEYNGTAVLTVDTTAYGDQTFYARWTGDGHQVTLVTNGGTINSGDVTSYVAGIGATLPSDVTRLGYDFGGWYRNSQLTGGSTTVIGVDELGDKVFYAKWTPHVYSITYVVNGGTIADVVESYTYGTVTPLPVDVTRSGYSFDGWYANSQFTGERIVSIQATDTGNKMFYAKWLGLHTVTFKDHDNTVLKTEKVPNGHSATAPANPYREGHVFNGWSVDFSSVTSDLTVTATYNEQAYLVSWRDYDGTLLKEELVDYGDDATPPETDPSREGDYTFIGWSGSYTGITGVCEVYAQYQGAFAYRLMGRRYLRKYTAATRTPSYAALQDAEEIVNRLCTVKWEPVSLGVYPTMPTHQEDALDQNVANRDWFDAAEFCAEHDENGSHRAYAQAACYKIMLPDSAVGKSLTSIKFNVTSDPYNPYGARLAVLTSETGEIPMDCHSVRNGDIHTEPSAAGVGVVPRLYSVDAKGNTTWWANTENVVLTPNDGLLLKKYLLVFVCLENYGRARNGWLEGSSYIRNDIEISLNESIDGLFVNTLNECVDDAFAYRVCLNGVLPEAETSGVTVIEVQGSGDVLPAENGPGHHSGVTDEQSCIGLRTVYAKFRAGLATVLPASVALVDNARPGAGFVVRRGSRTIGSVAVPYWRIVTSAMTVPFAVPLDFKPIRVRLDWGAWTGYANGGRFNVWLKRGELVNATSAIELNPKFYDGSDDVVDGWELLGTIDAGSVLKSRTFDIRDGLDGYFATVLLTAYVSCDGVNPDEDTPSVFGVSTSMDVDVVAETASGMSNGWKPDITLIG